ncbi:MAG: hypothetical protein HOM01_02140, partial [Kordiimonadaceae bacterium]|nr:hypothetical protein [Kordiimonadaceae bacterium]
MKFIKNNINTVLFTVMSFLSVILLILVFNIGSAPAQNFSTGYEEQPFGEYLAGRHALVNNDYGAAAEYYLQALALDPENIPLNQFALSVLITGGRFDEAAKISKRLIDSGEETNTSNLLVFFENVKNGNYEDALGEIDGLSDTGIINLVRPFFKTWILAKQGKFDEAEEMIAALDPESTFNFFNYYQSGLIYEFMGNIEKAEELYAKSLNEKGLLNIRAVEAYGHILRVQNKKQQAIDVYSQYLIDASANERLKKALADTEKDIKPEDYIATIEEGYAEIFYAMSTILMQDNVKRVASNFLQYALYFKEDFPLVNFLLAQIFESDKYYSGAVNELDKIGNNSPLYFQSKIQRAWLLDDMDQSEEALTALKKLKAEYQDSRDVMNSIAEFYRTHERYSEAILEYDEIVNNINQETERDWVLYYTRGIVLDQEKLWDRAEKDFRKALELRPEQPMVLNYLAYSWVDRGINYDEAKGMLE